MLRTKRPAGFTLIELLVVIAIIALLVSILLPSLKSARELARTTICATNMRAMQMAMTMYAQEFDGYAPAQNCSKTPGVSDNALEANYRTGITQLMAWEAGHPKEAPTKSEKAQWSICPSDRDPRHTMQEWDPRRISYTINGPSWDYCLPGDKDRNRAIRLLSIHRKGEAQRASELFMFAEATEDRGFGVIHYMGPDKIVTTSSKSNYGTLIKWNYMFRHQGDEGMNLVFFDGHVAYHKWEGTDRDTPPFHTTQYRWWH
jgi:prepilin-type N-terminal cleavage/methylation domain-containing protein/prepilin-type processing-associated H-X9-DG protein